MLRACFWLLAVILIIQLFDTTMGALTCFYLFIIGQAEIGACGGFFTQTREVWAEVLAAVLALLLAARNGGSSPPPPPPMIDPE